MVIYTLITLSPLAPVALSNAYLAHAITGECSGDCDVCGCSPLERANGTCCCQQKLQLQKKQKDDLAECCQKKEAGSVLVLRCQCPCGSGKALSLAKLPNSEILPFVFAAGLRDQLVAALPYDFPRRMSTRPGEPPDPPPRLLFSS
jgi:hypothetical protein